VSPVGPVSVQLGIASSALMKGPRTWIFDAAKLVSYVSQFTTLEPGDVITTGTPPGVTLGI
jgi:hypothetical protein